MKKAAPVPAASTVTVDVYNGDLNATGLAGQVSQALVSQGYKAGAVENASAQAQTVETGNRVFYGAGASANAAKSRPISAPPPARSRRCPPGTWRS